MTLQDAVILQQSEQDENADAANLPVKNTFIHFDEQKTGARGRALRRCSTDPNEACCPLPLVRPPPPSLVQDELKEAEEEDDGTGAVTPSRSLAGSSTASCSSLPASPGYTDGAATPETPFGSPPPAVPWAANLATWQWPGPDAVPLMCTQMNSLGAQSPYDARTWQPTSFTFTLMRADDVAMGLNGVVDRNGELQVQSVTPGSALDSWNRFQIPGDSSDRSVLPGDRVISVNGLTWPQAILKECEEKRLLKLHVVRNGP
eukprot:gb/GFBE01072895.1/.p1 GENE.gb/GFBE01072895.1/~~gb/GFBE01072895.1/.p1  ORF type:complete len:260 (+),score=41.68 gb/GFBE01072895.1/:1-780(+)